MTRKINGMKWHEDDEELMHGEANPVDGEISPIDLFDESNTSDMENENFVIVEDDGKTIIPNKQYLSIK